MDTQTADGYCLDHRTPKLKTQATNLRQSFPLALHYIRKAFRRKSASEREKKGKLSKP